MSKLKITSNNNFAVPGKPLSKEAFKALITEAENATFHSIGESKNIFKEWRKKNYG